MQKLNTFRSYTGEALFCNAATSARTIASAVSTVAAYLPPGICMHFATRYHDDAGLITLQLLILTLLSELCFKLQVNHLLIRICIASMSHCTLKCKYLANHQQGTSCTQWSCMMVQKANGITKQCKAPNLATTQLCVAALEIGIFAMTQKSQLLTLKPCSLTHHSSLRFMAYVMNR